MKEPDPLAPFRQVHSRNPPHPDYPLPLHHTDADMYPLRSIQFLAELVFPARSWQLADLQRVHAKAFEREASRYVNFQLVQGGAMLANPPSQQGAVSAAWVLGDRIRVQEQLTGVSRDEFEKRLDAFARTALAELKIPELAGQQYAVQSLVTPRVAQSAIDLMARSVLHFQPEDFDRFERPPALLGLRMSFPSAPVEEGQFHCRIETMQRDPRTIFIENVGVFRQKVGPEEVGRLIGQFVQTYDWIQEQLVGFIGRVEGRIVP